MANKFWKAGGCCVEELALPTRAIQLSGEELSSDEVASVELREAEAVHRTCNSRCLFKAAPMTPCVCWEQQLETGVSNKRLKRTLELLLHCGGPAEPRLLYTAVQHTAAVVWTGTTGTRPAHNRTQHMFLCYMYPVWGKVHKFCSAAVCSCIASRRNTETAPRSCEQHWPQ